MHTLKPIPGCNCTEVHPSYAKNKGGGIGGNMIAAFCASVECSKTHPLETENDVDPSFPWPAQRLM